MRARTMAAAEASAVIAAVAARRTEIGVGMIIVYASTTYAITSEISAVRTALRSALYRIRTTFH